MEELFLINYPVLLTPDLGCINHEYSQIITKKKFEQRKKIRFLRGELNPGQLIFLKSNRNLT